MNSSGEASRRPVEEVLVPPQQRKELHTRGETQKLIVEGDDSETFCLPKTGASTTEVQCVAATKSTSTSTTPLHNLTACNEPYYAFFFMKTETNTTYEPEAAA